MQVRTASFAPSPDWFNPFGSWEAMAHWNAMAFEWMTNGWKQWLQLTTAWPALERAEAATNPAVPVQAGTQDARNARSVGTALVSRPRANDDGKPRASSARAERASANTGAKRAAPKRSTRAASTRSRPRTRG